MPEQEPDRTDWERLRNMTDEEAEANALSDPDNPPHEFDLSRARPRVFLMRRAMRLTQKEFSARYSIPLGTLRDWEQKRSEPDRAARAYLRVIANDLEGAARAFAGEAAA